VSRHQNRCYRTVKVTAHLDSPLALSPEGWAPHLDALCEFVRAGKMRTIDESSGGMHLHDRGRRRGDPVSKPGQIPIPIARRFECGLPIPLCSFGIVCGREFAEHYHTSFPTGRASMLEESQRTVIAATGGPYKSFRLPLRMCDTPAVVWFAVLREQPKELRRDLRQIHHLGKKSRYGYGLVREWEIETINQDLSWFAESDDGPVLMRSLPRELVSSNVVGKRASFGAVCGPYWQRDLWREIWEPC
jgi:hypothetical protein